MKHFFKHAVRVAAGFIAAAPLPALAQAQFVDPGRHSFRVGVEGFRDNYKEDTVKLTEHSDVVSVTADYIHDKNGYFSTVQTRLSKGDDDYKSVSGTIKGITQYEGEARLLAGLRIPIGGTGGVQALLPYVGIGSRYFYDKSKGTVTSLGFFGYDRRILQFYIPIGMMWSFNKWGYTFSPMAELDMLIYGKVHSRFRNFDPGAENLDNTQKRGYGLRGEFMVGQQYEDFGWQFGPFVRWWNINDSETDTVVGTQAGTYLEPENTRLQAGAAFRVNF